MHLISEVVKAYSDQILHDRGKRHEQRKQGTFQIGDRRVNRSNVTAAQVRQAQSIADVVCVQNHYNLSHRDDEQMIADLGKQGVAYVPFFPLGGFTPLQSNVLSSVATRMDASPHLVALAWLLQRAPNILLIPGTSSVAHLRENLTASELTITPQMLAELDAVA